MQAYARLFVRVPKLLCTLLCVCIVVASVHAQKSPQKIEIIKPYDFRKRELPSEKTYKKKNTAFRRFYFNTVTRYNYIYNCNRLLNYVMQKAKDTFRDDYTRLLPLYNYSMDFIATAMRPQIDSILQKTTTAVLMRDLRNRWVDDLYLYMGKAYYFKKSYDSASMIFQFVQHRYADGGPETEGVKKKKKSKSVTRASDIRGFSRRQSHNVFTKETQGALNPHDAPARNEALIWLLRTYIDLSEFYDAVMLMDALQKDVYLPRRLKTLLDETCAYYYYKRKDYLQAAQYLISTIELSRDRQEKGRRAFLIGQLYNRAGRTDLATKFMAGATKYTYDPVLEVYARMNFILQETHPNIHVINDHIKLMLKLARQERFKRYRALVYYACSFMAIKKNDLDEALQYINTAVEHLKSNKEDLAQRNRIYVQLTDILWQKKRYYLAGKALDSVKLPDPSLHERQQELAEKQKYMKIFVANYDVKIMQDSLRRLAAMSPIDRARIVHEIAKTKEKEIEQLLYKKTMSSFAPSPMQGGLRAKKSGVWYFSNPQTIEYGAKTFQSRWGNRRNVDRWRVASRMDFSVRNPPPTKQSKKEDSLRDLTYKDFEKKVMEDIPLDSAGMARSDSILANALNNIGEIDYLYIKDYSIAKEMFGDILFRFPKYPHREDIYLRLYFTLHEQPKTDKEARARLKELTKKYVSEFPQGKYIALFTRDEDPTLAKNKQIAMQQEEHLYELAYKQYNWRNFPRSVEYIDRLDKMDTDSTYFNKTQYIRARYALAQKDYADAQKLLLGIMGRLEKNKSRSDPPLQKRVQQDLETLKKQSIPSSSLPKK